MNDNKKILIATGGTGGHVFPAYSLGKFFQKQNVETIISTDLRGFKFLNHYKDVQIKIINSDTIFKKTFLQKISSFIKVLTAISQSIYFLIKLKPSVIFGMGGYSSFPICVAALLLRIPFILYENNLLLGRANRYLLPYSKFILCSYKEIEGINQKYKNKILEVGNLIREDVLNYKIDQNKKYNNDNSLNILILGGSQAAKIFAEKLPDIFIKLKNKGYDLKIYQQCIPNQQSELENKYNKINLKNHIFTFSYDLTTYFSKVNIAITRAGSSMLAELLNCNIPLISIPLANSADGHQLKNAQYFKDKGYGFLIEESDIETKLFSLIEDIFKNRDLLKEVITNQKKFLKIDTKLAIYKNISPLINR